jgi:hypothetical protein
MAFHRSAAQIPDALGLSREDYRALVGRAESHVQNIVCESEAKVEVAA